MIAYASLKFREKITRYRINDTDLFGAKKLILIVSTVVRGNFSTLLTLNTRGNFEQKSLPMPGLKKPMEELYLW